MAFPARIRAHPLRAHRFQSRLSKRKLCEQGFGARSCGAPRRRAPARTKRPLVAHAVTLTLAVGGLTVALGAGAVLDALFVSPKAQRPPEPAKRRFRDSVTALNIPSPASVPPPTRRDHFTVVAGGDVSFGRTTRRRILQDADYSPLGGVERLLRKADLAFVNLESMLSERQTPHPENPLIFCGPPTAVALLERAGIDIVSLANNHAWDCAKPGLFETLSLLGARGIAVAGASRTVGASLCPTVLSVSGWSVAWLAVTDIWNQGPLANHPGKDHVAGADADQLVRQIHAARKHHDLVLVSYHGGSEYVPYPLQRTRTLFRKVVEAGAHAVIGHHPHIPHGVGWHKGRPLLYSLGNLVFPSHRDHPWTRVGFLASLTFRSAMAPIVWACPYSIQDGQPHLMSGQDDPQRERFIRHLRWLSVTVGGTIVQPADAAGCVELGPPPPKPSSARGLDIELPPRQQPIGSHSANRTP
jgi:poly-gamma-glutamate capsule biosynthesis protein CapA/YwtB (metallophosphatase superfamily)